jgi:serine/threonine protein kinase
MMETRVGTCLDRYEIDAELGHGAMGVVYRARDPKLGRTVAIKTVSIAGLDAGAEHEYRQRFVVEAHAAGRLSHPGIVTIFDVRDEGEPYLVMEYIEGQSLQQLVARKNRTLPLSTTLRLIQEVAEALHYAHAQGVVHRDIKPANILVTADGHPKIADFGIAKLNQSELTLPGRVLGSPAFMAPEQLSEESVDSRSDLFSLGVILYYMLTGHRPFQGNSTTTVCFKLVNQEPVPVSALGSKVPPELDKIVSRAMAKDPSQRYQTGMAMAADLRELREHSGFVRGEDRMGRVERDVIPRPVTRNIEDSATPKTMSLKSVEARSRPWKTKTLLSKAAVVFILLAMAVAGIVLWSMHTPTSRQVDVTDMQLPFNKSPGADTSSAAGQTEQAPAITSEVSPRVSSYRTPRTAHRANVQVPLIPAECMLQIEIEHHFANATASVWVDDRLVYSQPLQGEKKRHAIVFRKVVGHQFQVVRVVPGKHQIRVRVQSDDDSYDQSRTIAAAFVGGTSLLRIVCGDKGEGLQASVQKEADQ